MLYYNLGMEIKYPPENEDPKTPNSLKNLSHDQLLSVREELRKQYGEIG